MDAWHRSRQRRCKPALALAAASLVCYWASTSAFECSGMGRRYCANSYQATECPRPCRPEKCSLNNDTYINRAGVDNYREWKWIDLIKGGRWDNAYIHDEFLCVSSCWWKPWEARCLEYNTTDNGIKYCKELTCIHDKGTIWNEGDRYTGCHRDFATLERKKAWHKPTCDECAVVFPKACKPLLADYLDSSAGDSSELEAADSSQWDSSASDSSSNRIHMSDGSSAGMSGQSDMMSNDGGLREAAFRSMPTFQGSDSSSSGAPDVPLVSVQPEVSAEEVHQSSDGASSRSDAVKRRDTSSSLSKTVRNKGTWKKGHWDNGKWVPGKWVMLTAQGTFSNADSDESNYDYDSLTNTPKIWQALFIDEFTESDAVVAAITNVVFQLNTEGHVNEHLLTQTFAEASGVEPSQVIILHMVDAEHLFHDDTHNTLASSSGILTVSLGVVSSDPPALIKTVRDFNDEAFKFMLGKDANVTYLEHSISATRKLVAQHQLPFEALPYALLMPRERAVWKNDSSALNKRVKVITIAVAAAVSLIVLAMLIVVIIKHARSPPSDLMDESSETPAEQMQVSEKTAKKYICTDDPEDPESPALHAVHPPVNV